MTAWDLSCRDWEDRIRRGSSLMPSLPLFADEARDAVEFFNALRLPDVEGTPLMRDAAGEWFREIVAAVFGSRDPKSKVRHVKEVFSLAPKGSSKTTYGAALMMTAMLMNETPRAEFLFVGETQAVSDLAFGQSVGMVEADPALKRRFTPFDHLKEIRDNVKKSRLKIKTFDLSVLTGVRPVGVLVDELHLLGRHPTAARVIRQIRGGVGKHTDGFLIFITTQSDEPPTGAFLEELKMARNVRDGNFAGQMLPLLYEFPEDIARDPARWQNPTNWPMVTPNLGRSVRLDSLIQDFDAEKAKGEQAIQVWGSQHLNIQLGINQRGQRWRGTDHWLKAVELGLTLQSLLERSEVVCIGVDGGGLDDLLGLAVLGREMGTRRWLLWSRAWVHASVLDLRKSEASRFRDMEKDGDLIIVEDMEKAFGDVADIAAQVDAAGLLAKIGLDPMGVGAIVDALAERGIEGDDRVHGVPQGWTLNGAIKTAEIKLANGTLVHPGQALMTWAVGNAKAEPKGNAITITKQVAGTGKIDPLMAAINAVVLMSRNPEAPGLSIWDRPELWQKAGAAGTPAGADAVVPEMAEAA